MVGQTISHYKVLSEVGRGGMGVVYKAEDTKLKRPVALKFLRSDVLEDEEHKERFLREAQAAAALDHPNICTVYEIDEADGQTFLSMAYLEGETVKEKIKARPLKLEEALDIAIQTAQGLQAAHEKGIIHRDIKGANLMVTPQGQVKIMDFGLAQLAERSQLTKTATILGTPAYMSPEQSQRLPTDRRTDIWSLGVVIYEMVTARLPFEGERQEAVLYAIGTEDPEPITALRVGVPTELDFIVSKAMAKDAGERYQHVEEMIVDLRGLSKKLASGKSTILQLPAPDAASRLNVGTGRAAAKQVPRRSQRFLQMVVAGLSVALAVALFLITWQALRSPDPAPTPLRRFAFTPESLSELSIGRAAISPDARHIVYVSGEQPPRLWLHSLSRDQARPLLGSDGGSRPIWSPDSEWVAFVAGRELKKISIDGGFPITLCSISRRFSGGTWDPQGEAIIWGGGAANLQEVSARGGLAKPVFDGPVSELGPLNSSPYFLPSEAPARALLIDVGTFTRSSIYLLNLDTGETEKLADGSHGIYSRTGHVIYETQTSESGLWALPFSLETLKASGEAFPVAAGVGDASVADDGTLVAVDLISSGGQRLIRRDRQGRKVGEIGSAQLQILRPAVSPDGTRVVAEGVQDRADAGDIWVHEVDRQLNQRLTFDETRDTFPSWSPDGEWIAFRSDRGGQRDLWVMPVNGDREARPLTRTETAEFISTWAPDGRRLLYEAGSAGGSRDLWLLTMDENRSPLEAAPFLETPFNTVRPRISPDGRYVAYVSDESGRDEVYVRDFPEGSGWNRVSGNGGNGPRWSRDGTELFYVEGDALVAAKIDIQSGFTVGPTEQLFKPATPRIIQRLDYDVSADGHFVISEDVEVDGKTSKPAIRVIQNWFAEFRDREQD